MSVFLAFVLPLVYLLIYGFAMRLESKEIPLIIKDFDNSHISRAYIEQIFATNKFKIIPGMERTPRFEEAIDKSLAKAAIVIPPDFERRIKAGKTSNVQLFIDAIDVNNARVIANSIRAATEFFLLRTDIQNVNESINAYIRLWYNPGRREALFFVAGAYGVILWVYPSLFSALAMNREKEQGNIVQVYASGISAHEFILGKVVAYLTIALGQSIFLMVVGSFIFGLRLQGNVFPLTVGTVLYLCNSILFGLFIGINSESQGEAAQKVLGIGYLSSVLLSGFIYPINNLPVPLFFLSNFIPARYYIDISRDAFVRGTGWVSVGYIPLFLTLIALLLYLFSWAKLRRMQLKC